MPRSYCFDSLKQSFCRTCMWSSSRNEIVLEVALSRSTSKWGRSSRLSKALCFHSASRGGHHCFHLSVDDENIWFLQQVAANFFLNGNFQVHLLSSLFGFPPAKKENFTFKHSWKLLVAQLPRDVNIGGCWSATEGTRLRFVKSRKSLS